MIKKLTMINFKSFKNTTIDFTGKKGEPKKLAFIYGENGSGKTNIISAFMFLKRSTYGLAIYSAIDRLTGENKTSNTALLISAASSFFDFSRMAKNAKMIGGNDKMSLIFDFDIGGLSYLYTLSYHDGSFGEELRFPFDKKMVTAFSFFNGVLALNPKLVKSPLYEKDLLERASKYANKATFMAVLVDEFEKNNRDYMDKNINSRFLDFIMMLSDFSVSCSPTVHPSQNLIDEAFVNPCKNLLPDFFSGIIPLSEEKRLDNTTKALEYYLTGLMSDIKGVFYKTDKNEKEIRYTLFVKKRIAGEIRDIPFTVESTGTAKILRLFPYIIHASAGGMVFIDEMDTGIHDQMMIDIIEQFKDHLKGQFIATTHNTLILNYLKPEQAYIIDVDADANKDVFSLDQISPRIQKNHNMSERYNKGFYGGVPVGAYFDIDHLVELSEPNHGPQEQPGKKE